MSSGVMSADVERPQWVTLKWLDENGEQKSQKFESFLARLIQHEIAHLNGKINLDEVVPGKIEYVTFDPTQEVLRETKD